MTRVPGVIFWQNITTETFAMCYFQSSNHISLFISVAPHVSKYWRLDCLLNRFFKLATKNTFMMTSSNGNILSVAGHLCGEFTGPRWIPRTKASDAELWCFFYLRLNKRLSKQSWGWWFETLSHPLWRHCNAEVPQRVGPSWGESKFNGDRWIPLTNGQYNAEGVSIPWRHHSKICHVFSHWLRPCSAIDRKRTNVSNKENPLQSCSGRIRQNHYQPLDHHHHHHHSPSHLHISSNKFRTMPWNFWPTSLNYPPGLKNGLANTRCGTT